MGGLEQANRSKHTIRIMDAGVSRSSAQPSPAVIGYDRRVVRPRVEKYSGGQAEDIEADGVVHSNRVKRPVRRRGRSRMMLACCLLLSVL